MMTNQSKKMQMVNIPNILTSLRYFLGFLFFLIYTYCDFFQIPFLFVPYLLLFVLSLSESTDILDGYLARKYGQVTEVGKVFDPTIDSVTRLAIFFSFTQPPIQLPLIFVLLFLYRDSVTSILRTISSLRGNALAARTSGKIKAVIQAIAAFILTLLLIPYSLGSMEQSSLCRISTWVVSIAVAYSLLSCFDYIRANRAEMKKLFYITTDS